MWSAVFLGVEGEYVYTGEWMRWLDFYARGGGLSVPSGGQSVSCSGDVGSSGSGSYLPSGVVGK